MSKARNLANLLADGAVGADELASTLDLSSKTLTLPAGVGGGGSSITAGDSSVAVTDAGTGKVEVTVDNVEVADFTTGEIVFNETGANQDFRVEGDTEANLLFVDAGNDRIGVGTSSPAVRVQLNSSENYVAGVESSTTFALLGFKASDSTATTMADPNVAVGGTGDALYLRAGGTERARITSDGYLRMSASSGGIQFNGDTAAANALDDYEEGTWTPAWSATGTTFTMSNQVGRYVKVGGLVTAYCYLNISAVSGTKGEATLTGLPFGIENVANSYVPIWIGQIYNIDWPADAKQLFAYAGPNTTVIGFYWSRDATTQSALTGAQLESSNTGIMVGISYRA